MTKKNLDAESIHIAAPPGTCLERDSRPQANAGVEPAVSPHAAAGKVRDGAYTVNWNRQRWKFWPTASKVESFQTQRSHRISHLDEQQHVAVRDQAGRRRNRT